MDNTDVFSQMAAELNDHQVTNEDGNIAGEDATPQEEPAASEPKTTEDTDAPAREPEASQPEDELVEVASDESGKRYVPEDRFKKVYGKLKQTERELAQQRTAPQPASLRQDSKPETREPQPTDRTAALEVEILNSTLPQFDPTSDQYDEDLDALGAAFYRGNPGITKIAAARMALAHTRKLAMKNAEVKAGARTVKALQSDQGITSRVTSRDSAQVDPASMTLEEKEQWLKENGQW